MRTHLRRDDDGRQARLRLGLRRAMQHDATVDADIEALLAFRGLTSEQIQEVGRNALRLLLKAAARIATAQATAG